MRTSSLTSRAVCLLTSFALVAAGGCTRTQVHTFAAYPPGGPPKLDRTPDVGKYKIKYSVADGEEMRTLHGSKRRLGAGQPIGFERGPEGELIAIAGEERFPALLPPDARYAVWYTKTKEQTEFAEAMNGFGSTALPVLAVGGIVVVGLAAAALNDDDCRHNIDRDKCRRCRD